MGKLGESEWSKNIAEEESEKNVEHIEKSTAPREKIIYTSGKEWGGV